MHFADSKIAQAALFVLVSTSWVLAAPAPQRVHVNGNCAVEWNVDRPTKLTTYYGDKFLFSYRCHSWTGAGCTLTEGQSYTVSTGYTLGGSASGAGFLSEAIEKFAPSFSGSWSWTESKASSESASIICPEGGFICGATAQPFMCKVEGLYSPRFHLENDHACGELPAPLEYTSTSVCINNNQGNPTGKNEDAVMIFSMCIWDCDNCNKKLALDYAACPGSPWETERPEVGVRTSLGNLLGDLGI